MLDLQRTARQLHESTRRLQQQLEAQKENAAPLGSVMPFPSSQSLSSDYSDDGESHLLAESLDQRSVQTAAPPGVCLAVAS